MALPGVTTVIKDQFYTLTRTDIPLGPRVVVIAPRNTADATSDGTAPAYDYDPYFASNEQKVITAFGKGSGAHRGFVEAVAGGAPQVFIVPLPKGMTDANLQSISPVTIAGDGVDHNHGSHIIIDAAFAAAETASPDIIVAWGRGGHPTDWTDAATPSSVPMVFYADNSVSSTNSLAVRVSLQVMGITSRSNPCFAVMGIRPFVDPSPGPGRSITGTMTATQISNQVLVSSLADHNAPAVTAGMYLSIVGAELQPLGYDPTFGYSNGAALYAGYITQLNSWNNTTGKLVYNVSGVRYNPTRTQLDALSSKGVVPVGLDFNRRPNWIDGVTWGASSSDYTRLSTLRIVFDAVQLVRGVASGFVGEGATLANRNALETAITASLRGMQQAGALLASDFVVSYFPASNEAIVDLVLTPAFELRNIEISVSVQL